MDIKIYNTLNRDMEKFTPLHKDEVRIYTCGPTVYNYAHIGNLRAYVFMDLLARMFKYNGYTVLNAMNITDVGHLVSDADEGEDKMLKAARREQKSPFEIAEFYEKEFLENIDELNIQRPKYIVRATEHIKEMEKYVLKLLDNGYAYETDNTIYFDTSKLAQEGYLNKQQSGIIAGARVELDKGKKNEKDFALWIKAPENHIMKWDSFFGKAYPGWHLECSAMSQKYLGEVFDIHTGGTDHIPIHHENEIAQSIGATGDIPAKYWMHVEFLLVDGGKMSKSLGNVYTLKDLKDKGYSPLDFRYFLLNASYRKPINFTFDALDISRNSFNNLKTQFLEHKFSDEMQGIKKEEKDKSELEKLQEDSSSHFARKLQDYEKEFNKNINDDLNMPGALAVVYKVLKEKPDTRVAKLLEKMDTVLGLNLNMLTIEDYKNLVKKEENIVKDDLPVEVLALAEDRKKAKQNKDFELADKLREEIQEKGYIIKDKKDNNYEIFKNEN